MKLLTAISFFVLPFLMVSCTDSREELEIKSDGTGTLVIKTDLSKMLEMIKGFTSEEDLKKEGLEKAFDTTMLMKDYVDTAKSIPDDQKALIREGKVHLTMNVQESIGRFDMQFPFQSTDQLQQLYASLNSSTGGLKSLFGDMGKGKQLPGGGEGDDKSMPQIASVYDITVKDGLYSRKVNKERYAAFTQAIKLEEIKQMGSMFGEMKYTLTVKLFRPIKKISNPKAILSTDKKNVILSTDLMEVFEHPELLELEIEY